MIGSDDYRRILADARKLHGEDIEATLLTLKENGFSQIDCIRGVVDLTGASLADAKQLVHFSKAWSDVRGESDAFHASLESEVDET